MNKKLTKLQKKKRKDEFFETYSALILSKFTAKLYPHFIKIEIDGVECDYYPGAERINQIKNGCNNWSDLTHKEFLDHLQITLQQENFSSREEVLSLNDLGIFNIDLD